MVKNPQFFVNTLEYFLIVPFYVFLVITVFATEYTMVIAIIGAIMVLYLKNVFFPEHFEIADVPTIYLIQMLNVVKIK